MARRSNILRNWPKYLMQWGILTALVVFLSGLASSEMLQELLASADIHLGSTAMIAVGLLMFAAIVLFSKLFCGYICPAGTIQDLIAKFRTRIRLKSIKIVNGSAADKMLRIIKYAILFWGLYLTTQPGVIQEEHVHWITICSMCLLLMGSLVVDMFWCRYLCPLGAISNSLKFWAWMLVLSAGYCIAEALGAGIPWVYLIGALCLVGYFLEIFNARPQMQILHVTKNEVPCNNCGNCVRKCPYHIDLRSFHDGKVNHVDCTLCGECIAACHNAALTFGLSEPTRSKAWRIVPPLLTIILIIMGIWAGCNWDSIAETFTGLISR
jgi:polyferredoxin